MMRVERPPESLGSRLAGAGSAVALVLIVAAPLAGVRPLWCLLAALLFGSIRGIWTGKRLQQSLSAGGRKVPGSFSIGVLFYMAASVLVTVISLYTGKVLSPVFAYAVLAVALLLVRWLAEFCVASLVLFIALELLPLARGEASLATQSLDSRIVPGLNLRLIEGARIVAVEIARDVNKEDHDAEHNIRVTVWFPQDRSQVEAFVQDEMLRLGYYSVSGAPHFGRWKRNGDEVSASLSARPHGTQLVMSSPISAEDVVWPWPAQWRDE